MPRPPLSVQTFSSLVAEQVEGLAAKCESLAKERERWLHEEIAKLQKELGEQEPRFPLSCDMPDVTAMQELQPKLQTDCATMEPEPESLSACTATNLLQRWMPQPVLVSSPVRRAEDDQLVAASVRKTAGAREKQQDDLEVRDVGGPFHLHPELIHHQWTAEGVVPDHRGAYFDRVLHQKTLSERCVLQPASDVKLGWDIFGIPILAWDIIMIPMGVFDIGSVGDEMMASSGWITLLYWTIDMPMVFFTGFYNTGGDLILDLKKIAHNYLRHFFFLDMAIIVSDWVSCIIEQLGDSAPTFLSNLAVLRILRVSRFIRLLRLRRLKAKMQTLEDSMDDERALVVLHLAQKIVGIILVNHYIACAWFALGSSDQIASAPYRWLTAVWYPQYDYKDLGNQKMSDGSWDYQYLTSLHWAIAQFTPGPQNIQPQNSIERLFAIGVLLFGLVVFSSFIASVTQARAQMVRMLSTMEKDSWLLRKFCRQHDISRELQVHVKRYVELVIIPDYQKLSLADISFFPKLSEHLRSQLLTELLCHQLKVHPFFSKLHESNEAVTNHVCNHAIQQVSMACTDIAFSGGVLARFMILVTKGLLDYIPIHQHHEESKVNTWCSEAVLWTSWIHQGQLQASVESAILQIDGSKLRSCVQENGFVMALVKKYGQKFCEGLNQWFEKDGMPSDLQDHVALDVDIGDLVATNYLWRSSI